LIDVKTWLYTQLSGDAGLQEALGSSGRILEQYPYEFKQLPILTYSEANDVATIFRDDKEAVADLTYDFDIWIRLSDTTPSTTPIAAALDTLMNSLLFTRGFSSDVPDPEQDIRHKHLQYTRRMTALDIL